MLRRGGTAGRGRAIAGRVRAMLARLVRERRGNVFIIVAFAMIPMVFATGMGIDYSRAARLRTKLNAVADAAALAAVTQAAMQRTDAEAKTIATNMFNVQAEGLASLVYDPADLTVTITPTYGATIGRIAEVRYAAESKNAFGGILGRRTIAIAGSSTANATKAPYIDFYLLLDTSPSMLLPATSAGLAEMRDLVGCAFACHMSDPHSEGIYVNAGNVRTPLAAGARFDGSGNVKLADGTFADSYWLAQNRGITLRIDAEQVAVQDLTHVAAETAAANQVIYRMAVNRFDYGPNFGTVSPLTSDLDAVRAAATGLELTRWYRNSWITDKLNIDDMSTDFKTAFARMDKLMPDPGSGETASDPQEIMFIITDGMSDENIGGRTHRELQRVHLDQCDAIKNDRGIRIAILYTEYLPESLEGDAWSQDNVAPHLSRVEPALRTCASDGLFYKVTTDDSISAALAALFRQAVSTAHLTG